MDESGRYTYGVGEALNGLHVLDEGNKAGKIDNVLNFLIQ